MKFSLKVALRFLGSSKGQTILIALGIGVGVSVQIFIGLLIQGLQASLIDKTVGNSSQITILSENEDKKISNWVEIVDEINEKYNEIKSITPVIDSPAFIENVDNRDSILIRGFDYNSADEIYNIYDNMVEGKVTGDRGRALIGKELAEEINKEVGESFTLISANGEKNDLYIEGIFDFNVSQLNGKWVLTSLDTAQEIFNYDDSVSSIEMQVKDVFGASDIAGNIYNNFKSNDIVVENWIDDNGQLLSGLKGQDISSFMIQIFVLVAVLLGISSVLAITVVQKSKQIGILKAMGVKDRTASLIFLFQGLILGVIGAVLGLLIGLGLLYSFQTFAKNPDGTPVVEIYYNVQFIIFSCIVAVFVSIIAALIPARKSLKLSPIEVIRYG